MLLGVNSSERRVTKDKFYHRIIDKFNLAAIGLLGPDFLFGIALGQLSSARKCVKLFKEDEYLLMGKKWTYKYAFFMDMGCVHLTSPDYPEGFPINGQQLHYLVKHDHLELPDMKAMAIEERNAIDALSRILTVWQALWFSVGEIRRFQSGLPITSLELTALSFVLVMIATSFCWFKKPSITVPQTIPTKANKLISQIRIDAKKETHPNLDLDIWYRTPLDFIRDDRWGIGTHWSYYVRILDIMNLNVISRPVTSRPWDRFPSDQWIPVDKIFVPMGFPILLAFSSSFLIGWNFYFPTKIEQGFWRALAIYHAIFGVIGGTYYLIEAWLWAMKRHETRAQKESPDAEDVLLRGYEIVHSLMRSTSADSEHSVESQTPPGTTTTGRFPIPPGWLERYVKVRRLVTSWRNISADSDPDLAMPLHVIFPVTILCVVYIFARGFLYIEDFISLRLQPVNTYYQPANNIIPIASIN